MRRGGKERSHPMLKHLIRYELSIYEINDYQQLRRLPLFQDFRFHETNVDRICAEYAIIRNGHTNSDRKMGVTITLRYGRMLKKFKCK